MKLAKYMNRNFSSGTFNSLFNVFFFTFYKFLSPFCTLEKKKKSENSLLYFYTLRTDAHE